MKETQFIAPILLERSLMYEILENIRDKYGIDNRWPYPPLRGTLPKC